jgi:3-oxoacyl-[acyl-carrier protein] reductase
MEHGPRTLFITGVTSGIGHEVLCLAIADGFSVEAVVRNEQQRRDLLLAHPDRLVLHVADLRDRVAVSVVAHKLSGRHFTHILLNAGYADLGTFDQISDESLCGMLEANLISHMILLKHVLVGHVPKRTALCLVSSLVARIPGRRYATYGLAKAGVSYLASAIALEYPSVRVLCAEIGGVATPFHSKARSNYNTAWFKSQSETGRRLYQALLTREGVTSLYWDWAALRFVCGHFRSPILAIRTLLRVG